MFFIMGISQGEQQLDYDGTIICGECGRYGHIQVFMTYMYFSFFFIPIFKWGRRYYVRMSCCQSLYELAPEVGRAIACGEDVTIRAEDMVLIDSGSNHAAYYERARNFSSQDEQADDLKPYQKMLPGISEAKTCEACGYIAPADFVYCPKCGKKL